MAFAGVVIGGPSWEVAGRIWYETLVDGLPTEPNFLDLALATVDKAADLYGFRYQRIVAEAWASVGIVLPYDELMADNVAARRPSATYGTLLRRLLPR